MIIGHHRELQHAQPVQHTTKPIVTGASVIALTYNGGVVIGTDTLCSYGSMADFKSVKRIEQIANNTVIAATGEFSDFQEVVRQLHELNREALQHDDGVVPSPRDFGNYLARVQYGRRNKLDPLYLQNVIAGFHNGQRYLAQVDLYGMYLEHKFITTGFANYFCKSIISNYWKEDCTEQQAKDLIKECFKVLYCRDCRAHDVIQIAVVDANGVRTDAPERVDTKWDYDGYRNKANEVLHTQ